MKKIALATALIALSGCVTTPPTQLITTIENKYTVNFGKIEVDDYATSKDVRPNDGIYFTGWLPISDKEVTPPFHEAFTKKIRGTLRPSGNGGSLDIAIIDSGFFMDSRASDSIVFVGIASALRDREYKCTVIVNMKANGKSTRKDFENIEKTNRVFGDITDQAGFISNCQNKLATQLANYVAQTF